MVQTRNLYLFNRHGCMRTKTAKYSYSNILKFQCETKSPKWLSSLQNYVSFDYLYKQTNLIFIHFLNFILQLVMFTMPLELYAITSMMSLNVTVLFVLMMFFQLVHRSSCYESVAETETRLLLRELSGTHLRFSAYPVKISINYFKITPFYYYILYGGCVFK